MPSRAIRNDEYSASSSSDSDPDFVPTRYSSDRYASTSSNLHRVRRPTRRNRTRRIVPAPINVKTIPVKRSQKRGNVRQRGKKSPMLKNGNWTILSWLINWVTLKVGTRVQYRDGEITLDGKVSRAGILCSCCNETITVKEFSFHAGSNKCEAYKNTYTRTGKSLLQCQEEAWGKQDIPACKGFQAVDTQKEDVNKNDDICNVCGCEGKLICCDCCPLTYHEACVGIETLPEVPFNCPICVCTICGMVGGDQAPSFRCFQCEELYHWQCVGGAAVAAEGDPSRCTYFCGESCKQVNMELQQLLGIPLEVGNDGLTCTLNQRMGPEQVSRHGMPWADRMERNAKVALAYAVFEECFQPIIDSRTGLDRIPTIVFNSGSNLSRLDCRGFYTFTLETKDDVIAAASIRVHGTKLAEMPFIGTREKYRHGGMCRRLVDAIGSVLLKINVEKLVVPSALERVDYWTTHFGFEHISEIQRKEMLSMNLMMFRDAILLQKTLPLHDVSNDRQDESGEAMNGNIEPQGGNDGDDPGGEDQPLEPLPFDLNLEPPEDEVPMNNVQKNGSLGIFLTLEQDGSLQLTKLFIDHQECVKRIKLRR